MRQMTNMEKNYKDMKKRYESAANELLEYERKAQDKRFMLTVIVFVIGAVAAAYHFLGIFLQSN